jgi:hypothetical protein
MKMITRIWMALGIMMMLASPASASTETRTYGSPALGQGDLVSSCLSPADPGPAAGLNSCVTFAVPPGAIGVVVSIRDDSGFVTYATVGQDYNDDGTTDASQNFCGMSGEFGVQATVALGVAEIIVFPHGMPGLGDGVYAGSPSPCAGIGTSGTVTVTWMY